MDEYDPIKLIQEINNAQQKTSGCVHSCFTGMELNEMQAIVLYHILEEEKSKTVYLKDISNRFGISSSTASQIIKQLKKKGYIVDVRKAEDARFRKLTATEKAKNIEENLRQQIDRFRAFLKERYLPNEIRQLYDLLEKI